MLKGRWRPERKITRVSGPVREIYVGEGLTELRKDLEVFTMMPVMTKQPPNWKKPAIIGSLVASGAAISAGLTLAGSGIGLLLLVAGMGWMSVVIGANSTQKKEKTWKVSTRPRSGRGNARKRRMRAAQSSATVLTVTSR